MKISLKKSSTAITMLSVYFLLFISQISASLDTISPSQYIRDGATLVSAGGSFELGFFTPGNSKNRYLGIWCRNVLPITVVWVANRETPLSDSLGSLSFNHQGVLHLTNGKNSSVWSSNKTSNAQNPVMQLLDSGNLVVKDGNDNDSDTFIWQSFDFPCNTLLPLMKIGRNLLTGVDTFLSSWRSPDDPAKGQLSFLMDPRGFPQLVVRNATRVHYRLGSWNGLRFTGSPELPIGLDLFEYKFVFNKNELYYSYDIKSSLMTRLVLNESGFLERFLHTDLSNDWKNVYSAPRDACDNYSVCGAYMSCKIIDGSHGCTCLEGFEPKSPKDWSKGCSRRIPLHPMNCMYDVFWNYTGFKLPDTSSSWFNQSMNLVECKEMCLRNCKCSAYANSDIRGSGCLLWFGDLIDMRDFSTGGQDLYIRMSSSKTDQSERKTNSSKKMLVGIIISSAVLVGMLVLGIMVRVWNKKHRGMTQGRNRMNYNNKGEEEDMELPLFDLATIVKATDSFSSNNRLGQGGFGPVYKGRLVNGQEIAVKRLSKSSSQGLTEFKNEIILIAKLQHRNLVKLLGCCIQEEETMLIYEFMPNKSLDFFIFDQIRSKFLDWKKRLLIIGGIARGLLYLHQDSRLRIIHRDLKASNVLLDKDMNPKISDFGMARMFGADQTEANTNKVVGTYGYMSPEYAVDGLFSLKSDIFSFGVLVLEIVTGKKNRGFSHPDHNHNLLGHAWKLWMEERPLELVDSALYDDFCVPEGLRCIHVGLLCVQQRPEDRPNMSSVVLMLGSTESSLPEPKQPGFFTERNMPNPETPAETLKSSSINEVTISNLDPR